MSLALGFPGLQWAAGLVGIAPTLAAPATVGSHFDPNGAHADAGNIYDPNGAHSDAGGIYDPDG